MTDDFFAALRAQREGVQQEEMLRETRLQREALESLLKEQRQAQQEEGDRREREQEALEDAALGRARAALLRAVQLDRTYSQALATHVLANSSTFFSAFAANLKETVVACNENKRAVFNYEKVVALTGRWESCRSVIRWASKVMRATAKGTDNKLAEAEQGLEQVEVILNNTKHQFASAAVAAADDIDAAAAAAGRRAGLFIVGGALLGFLGCSAMGAGSGESGVMGAWGFFLGGGLGFIVHMMKGGGGDPRIANQLRSVAEKIVPRDDSTSAGVG